MSAALRGRVAVVTGGSRGIGRAIALRLAAAGADCAITYRREQGAARDVVAAIQAAGRRGLAVPLDLGEPAQAGRAVEHVGEAFSLVLYLASEDAGFLTGQTIVIDGGLTIVSPLESLARGPREGERA